MSRGRAARRAARAPSFSLFDVAWRFAPPRRPALILIASAGEARVSHAWTWSEKIGVKEGSGRLPDPSISPTRSASRPLGVQRRRLVVRRRDRRGGRGEEICPLETPPPPHQPRSDFSHPRPPPTYP